MGKYVKVLNKQDINEGEIKPFDVEGKHIIIVKIDNELHALSGFCTHEEADLANGFLIEDRIVCPLHLSQFDCRTGEVLNPPATLPLQKFKVKIEGDSVFLEV